MPATALDSRYTQVTAMRITPTTMLATAGVAKRVFTWPRIAGKTR